jgi:hypothetical protein
VLVREGKEWGQEGEEKREEWRKADTRRWLRAQAGKPVSGISTIGIQ